MIAHPTLGHSKLFGATMKFGLTDGRERQSHYMKGERIINILRDNDPEQFIKDLQNCASNQSHFEGNSTTQAGSQSLGKIGNLLSKTMTGGNLDGPDCNQSMDQLFSFHEVT